MQGKTFECDMMCKGLTEESLKNRDGKECIVFNSPSGICQLYKIHEIEGCKLPEAIMQPWQFCRDNKSINMIWRILKEQYQQEKFTALV